MTMAIVRETLENLAACCQILDTDPDLAKEVHAALERLPQFEIGSRGELLEWNEELEEAEPEHRHTSHLYALYPAHLISTDGTPELANACRRTLELRGDESTGWALAWRISLWAHLHDGEHAYQVLKKQLQGSGYSVDACGDGLEALDYLQLTAYDAVILDIMLPGVDGLSVLKKMRTAGDKTPVLLLTARGSVEDRVAGLDLGADDYLVKPWATSRRSSST